MLHRQAFSCSLNHALIIETGEGNASHRSFGLIRTAAVHRHRPGRRAPSSLMHSDRQRRGALDRAQCQRRLHAHHARQPGHDPRVHPLEIRHRDRQDWRANSIRRFPDSAAWRSRACRAWRVLVLQCHGDEGDARLRRIRCALPAGRDRSMNRCSTTLNRTPGHPRRQPPGLVNVGVSERRLS